MIAFEVTRRFADRTAGVGQLILDWPTGQITVLASTYRGGGRGSPDAIPTFGFTSSAGPGTGPAEG